jgi:polar amino acid transport system substrate-binding protein
MRKIAIIVALFSFLSLLCISSVIAGPAFDKIKKRGELIVGTTASQPPLIAQSKEGEVVGMDAVLAKMIGQGMGVEVKFATMPFANLLPALAAGEVDMVLSGLTMTPKRNTSVAFVGPYYISGKGVLTKTDKIAALQEPKGLNRPENTVGVLQNSTSQMFARSVLPQAKLKAAESYDEAIDLLLQGKLDAVIADLPFCAFAAFKNRDKGLIAGQARFTYEPLGIALPEDTLLINWMENFMMVLQGSGTLKRIQEHWLNDEVWAEKLP